MLFIELSEMGSTILASAAIRRVQERYREPSTVRDLQAERASLRLLGLFAEECIFTMRDDSLGHLAPTCWRFIRFCRARRIDTTIDLELFSRVSSLLCLLSGATTSGSASTTTRRGPVPRRAPDAPRCTTTRTTTWRRTSWRWSRRWSDPAEMPRARSRCRSTCSPAAGADRHRADDVRPRPARARSAIRRSRPRSAGRRATTTPEICCRSARGRSTASPRWPGGCSRRIPTCSWC